MLLEIQCAPLSNLTPSLRGDIRKQADGLLSATYRTLVEDRKGYVVVAHKYARKADEQPTRLLSTQYGLACLDALERASVPDEWAQPVAASALGGEVDPTAWRNTPAGAMTVGQCLAQIKMFAGRAYAVFPAEHPKDHVLYHAKRLNVDEGSEPPAWIEDETQYPLRAPHIGLARQLAYAADQFAQLIPEPGAEAAAKLKWTACCADELEPALGGSGGEGGP
ncbi:MAG: hypothetical protein L6Q95_13465 [Planctomycetes bacterium]|nr:hypothetical protein [Planctomycetota bacterium]